MPVGKAYLPDPPVTVRVTFAVNSPGGLPGTGVSVTAPVAVNISPLFVTKTSNDVAWSTPEGNGLTLVMNAVLAPFSTPFHNCTNKELRGWRLHLWAKGIR